MRPTVVDLATLQIERQLRREQYCGIVPSFVNETGAAAGETPRVPPQPAPATVFACRCSVLKNRYPLGAPIINNIRVCIRLFCCCWLTAILVTYPNNPSLKEWPSAPQTRIVYNRINSRQHRKQESYTIVLRIL